MSSINKKQMQQVQVMQLKVGLDECSKKNINLLNEIDKFTEVLHRARDVIATLELDIKVKNSEILGLKEELKKNE